MRQVPAVSVAIAAVLGIGLGACADGREPARTLRADTIQASPVLSLGAADAPEAETFSGVYSGFLEPDRFVIGDRGSHEVRVFDLKGHLVRRFGRSGQGPGEFVNIRWVTDKGDSIVVLDSGLDRVSVFTSRGDFARSFGLPVERLEEVQWVEPFGGGFLLAATTGIDPRQRMGLARDSLQVLLLSSPQGNGSASVVAPWARVGNLWWRVGTIPNKAFTLDAVVDGPMALAAVSRGTLWFAENEEPKLFSVRQGQPPDTISLDDGVAPGKVLVDEGPIRTRLYEQLVSASDGSLWLSRYDVDGEDRAWDVLDASGRLVAYLPLPHDLRILDISDNEILARRQDDLGVERVELWRYMRPQSS